MRIRTTDYVAWKLYENSGNFTSGNDIALKLDISRTAVKKAIDSLISMGFSIETRQGKGYRLNGMPDKPFRPAVMAVLLKDGYKQINYEFYEVVDTTMRLAVDFINRYRFDIREKMLYVFAAGKQTHASGRFARSWDSPEGGIWFSGVARSFILAHYSGIFSLGVALEIMKMIKTRYGIDLLLKWPNDIMYKDKKIAGILLGGRTEIDTVTHVIMGVGINLNNEIPDDLKGYARNLKSITGKEINPSEFMAYTLEAIYDYLLYFEPARVLRRANDLLYKKGKTGLISLTDGRKIKGIIEKIGENGELIAVVDGKKQSFYAAEIDRP